MKPLLINDSLFFWRNGKVRFSWCLPWDDGYTREDQDAFLNWAIERGVDGVMMRLLDEDCATPFKDGKFMGELDPGKYKKFIDFICRVKSLGGKMVFCLFDGKASNPKYPYHNDPAGMERFIAWACQLLRPFAYAFVLGCETNEYFSVETVRYGINLMKRYAPGIPCGSHEQWNPDKREFCGGDFCCYETRNHPKDGDSRSVADMVREVEYVISKLPPNIGMWVSEFNWNNSERCLQQARALADLPRVIGVGMPLR